MDNERSQPPRTVASAVQALGSALDGLQIACCAVDLRDSVLACNETLVRMFPAQEAQLRPGTSWSLLASELSRPTFPPSRNAWLELPGIGALRLWHRWSGSPAALASAVRPVVRECLAVLELAPEGRVVLHGSSMPGRRLQDLIAEQSSDVVTLVRRGMVTYVSPAVRRMLGWDPRSLEGLSLLDFVHPDDGNHVRQQLEPGGTGRLELQARMRCADGEFRWVEATVAPLRQAADGSVELVLNIRDIAARKAMEYTQAETLHSLEHAARADSLTGIGNRRSFDEHLDEEWRRCRREGKPLAVLLLDVDLLKQINDRDGHQAGDRVLQRVAGCVQNRALRAGDHCARYGGDEFAMVMPNTTIDQAMKLAEGVRSDVARSRGVADEAAPPATVSIGVAASNGSASSATGLLSHADEALYQAKRVRDTVLAWKEGVVQPPEKPPTRRTSGTSPAG